MQSLIIPDLEENKLSQCLTSGGRRRRFQEKEEKVTESHWKHINLSKFLEEKEEKVREESYWKDINRDTFPCSYIVAL